MMDSSKRPLFGAFLLFGAFFATLAAVALGVITVVSLLLTGFF